MRCYALGLVLLFAFTAAADTVFFKDGTQLDGRVTRLHENAIAIELSKGRMVFPMSQVESIEENDKVGDYRLSAYDTAVLDRMLEMERRSGLTDAQQRQVKRLLRDVDADSTMEQERAMRALKSMAGEVDIRAYLEMSLANMGPGKAAATIGVIKEIDPAQAASLADRMASAPYPEARAAALKTLSGAKDEVTVKRIAGGLLDPEPAVQRAAAEALASGGNREASPALVEAMRRGDPLTQRTARAALERLWNTGNSEDPPVTASDWDTFVRNRAAAVGALITAEQLEPNFRPNEADVFQQHHIR